MICSSGSRRPGRRCSLLPPSPTHSSGNESTRLRQIWTSRSRTSGRRFRSPPTQVKAEAATKMSHVRANIDKRTHQVDAKVAADDANLAEADTSEALDFADWAVENAQVAMLGAIDARAYADKLAKRADNS